MRVQLSTYNGGAVTVTSAEVQAFRRSWPCSGLTVRAIRFEFAANGDLVAVTGDDTGADGSAMLALANDARTTLDRAMARRARKLRQPKGRPSAAAVTWRRVASATRGWFRGHPSRVSAQNFIAAPLAGGSLDMLAPRVRFARLDADRLASDRPGVLWQAVRMPQGLAAVEWQISGECEADMVSGRLGRGMVRRLNARDMRSARQAARASGFRPAWG